MSSKKKVVLKLSELIQHEKDLKSKEADLQEWHQKLSQREDEIKKKEDRLSLWEKELGKIAAQVAEEKGRMRKTVEPVGTSVPAEGEKVPFEEKEKITGKAESLPNEEEPMQDEPIEEDGEEGVPGRGSLRKVKEKKKKKKRFGLFR